MAAQPIVNRSTILKMIALLDHCYKLGVEAAYNLQDDGLAREFLQSTSEAGVYGFLSDSPIYMSWQEWTLRLMSKVRSKSWNGIMTQFFYRLGYFGANYLSAFLPVSQAFLNKGVEDYIKAPEADDYNLFSSRTRVWWTKQGIKTVSTREWVDTLQLMTFDLERRDSAIWESDTPVSTAKKIALKSFHYDMFRRCAGLAMLPKYN